MREYGKFLSNNMFLKVPTGAEWKIGLVIRGDDEVWLQGGRRNLLSITVSGMVIL